MEGPADLQSKWNQDMKKQAVICEIQDNAPNILFQQMMSPEEIMIQLSDQHRQHTATIQHLKEEHQLQLEELLKEEQEQHLKKIQELQMIIDHHRDQ